MLRRCSPCAKPWGGQDVEMLRNQLSYMVEEVEAVERCRWAQMFESSLSGGGGRSFSPSLAGDISTMGKLPMSRSSRHRGDHAGVFLKIDLSRSAPSPSSGCRPAKNYRPPVRWLEGVNCGRPVVRSAAQNEWGADALKRPKPRPGQFRLRLSPCDLPQHLQHRNHAAASGLPLVNGSETHGFSFPGPGC